MPAEGEDTYAYRGRKYGASAQDTDIQTARMTQLGAQEGFTFDYFEGMKIVNTQDAHILLDYARDFGLQTELNLRLVAAFYSERKDISDRDVLRAEVQNIGLNVNDSLL